MEKNKVLEQCRIEKGLSYQDMADRVKISKVYYWQIENNKRRILYEQAFKIAKALDKKPDDLFYHLFQQN